MKIAQVKIKGFRNFKESEVNFSDKSLLIGANDIGKSNLIYALRIFLDKTLSESDIEPSDSDFFAHEETNEIQIILKFDDITEDDDCILAKFKGNVSDEGELYLAYNATRERSGRKIYNFSMGKSEAELIECTGRWYLSTLNLTYVSSNRDLNAYIKREKKKILEETKTLRSEPEIDDDIKKTALVQKTLERVNSRVSELHYIRKATGKFNKELKEISAHHEDHELVFDAGGSDPEKFIKSLQLLDKVSDRIITVGGDGRNNQIFLAMWAAQQEEGSRTEVTFFCIEEPEAHLHPHQQRRLAEYLSSKFSRQVVITTHSPQIASEFSPNSIIRLCEEEKGTIAANKGCSEIISDSFYQFGYRMSVLPAEGFFADVVFLVEGVTEVMFYKALAAALGINLDRENISIIAVEGIGFAPYYKLYSSLHIPIVLRTDNDIFKLPKKKTYSCAGIKRAVKILMSSKALNKPEADEIEKEKACLDKLPSRKRTPEVKEFVKKWSALMTKANIFLSKYDLEWDLLLSPLKDDLLTFCEVDNRSDAYDIMSDKKATFIYSFLKDKSANLAKLSGQPIVKPLLQCRTFGRKSKKIT